VRRGLSMQATEGKGAQRDIDAMVVALSTERVSNQIIFHISSRPRQPDTQITVERARKMKDSLPRTPHFRFKYKRILGAKVHGFRI